MEPPKKELTLDAARHSLELHVRGTRWLRRDLAKKLTIESFERSGSFHTVLRSFTEARGTGPAHLPYRGERIDGPENGRPPQPWDIPVDIPGTFINQDHRETIPHTDVVKTCHHCNGDGQVTCGRCGGVGRVSCSSCGGDGRVSRTRTVTRTNSQGQSEQYSESYSESCGNCSGDGKVTCSDCHGSGRVTCPTCSGATRLRHFQQLLVAWKTKVSDDTIEKTDLPDELVAGAIGIVILAEEEDRLEAITNAGAEGGPYRGGGGRINAEVNAAANRLIQSHRFPGGTKLHRQSLVVRAVPVYEARYRWGKEVRRFWVYGIDEQIYAPKYPLSILRIGLAAGIPGGALAGLVAVGMASSQRPPPPRLPPPQTVATMTAPPIPTPPPTPLPTQLPPAPLQSATGAKPVAPPGKVVVEIRTEPPGAEVLLAGKKVGTAPLFAVIASKGTGVCTFGKCAVGRCVEGRTCEPVTRAVLRAAGNRTTELEIGASNGPVIEHRF